MASRKKEERIMHRVNPTVRLIGETLLDPEAIAEYLKEVGAPEWTSDGVSDSEVLTEFMGRLCYRSWAPGLNANVTKVREGNAPYLKNIIASGHGSVLEHGSSNWIIQDVSRVFTHELVRHRVGTAFSQESMRYVRLDDLGLWIPPEADEIPGLAEMCEEKVRADEAFLKRLAEKLDLDAPGRGFEYKKKWTSFMRRFAPDGMATVIGLTINHRSLRHLLELRTSKGAEVEIRTVFDQIAFIATGRWPALFQDFRRNDDCEWISEAKKI
jgi:thymidylate synthase (FAD)